MHRLCRSLAILLVLVALAPRATAQIGFDPYEHLEGYAAAYLDEYSRLYEFQQFEEQSGERLSDTAYTAIVERWEAEKKRVADRVVIIESDPVEGYLYDVDWRLGRRDFFEETEVVRVDTFSPFFFYVERPFKRKDGFEDQFASQLGPWVTQLSEVFDATYSTPLRLERKKRFGGVGIVVLASRGRYSDYADANFNPGLHDSAAHYDPKLRVAVTHRAANSAERAAKAIRRSLLHEVVHALQHAHCEREMPQDTWLTEGMAEYLSYHTGRKPDCLTEHPIDRQAVERLVPFTDPEVRELFLPSIKDLAGFRGYGGVVRHVGRKLRKAGYVVRDDVTLAVHYAHANLLVHFLHHGNDGKYREAMLRYVGRSFGGEGGDQALEEAFEGIDLAQIDAGFIRYVRDEARRLFPDLDLATLPLTISGSASESGTGTGAAMAARSPFDPSSLRPSIDSLDAALASAVAVARRGAMKRAAGQLNEWLRDNEGDESAARVRSEIDRMNGFIELRRKFAQQLRNNGKKLNLMLDEGRLLAKVSGMDGTSVKLAKNRLGLAELDLETVDPVQLADLMRNEKKYGMRHDWLMAYPYVLAGESDGKRNLFDSTEASRSLESDAGDEYDALRTAGRAIEELGRLAVDAKGFDSKNAGDLVDRVVAMLDASGKLDIVSDRRGALIDLARAALEKQFESRGLAEMFQGKVTKLADDVVRFEYSFDDESELKDFTPIDGEYPYGAGLDVTLPDFGDPFKVKRGALEAMGLATIRHRAKLIAPSITYEVSIHEPLSTAGIVFCVGFCDNGFGSFGASINIGALMVLDKKSGTSSSDSGSNANIFMDKKYLIAIENDGKICRSKVDGEQRAKVPMGPRRDGSVFLSCAMGSTLKIHRLSIQGELANGALAAMGSAWVDEQLKARGLME